MPHRKIRDLIKGQSVVAVTADTSIAEAASLMRNARVGALMVVEETKLVGIFTERDALYRVLAIGIDPNTTRVADVMTKSPSTASPDKPFGHALHIMYERGFRHVPVVEQGRPVGMISARDALGPELKQFADELGEREHIAEILG